MKIYFENGKLRDYESRNIEGFVVRCDAGDGYSNNVFFLEQMLEQNCKHPIYTNSVAALVSRYSWNMDLNDSDIFMRESANSEFKRISEIYGSKIRPRQNVRAMFFGGCFGIY